MADTTEQHGWKYMAMARKMERAIRSGEYAVGARLPSERMLARDHSVTVMTVREALQVLAEKGLILREHGRGTFVAFPPVVMRQSESAGKPIALIGLNPGRRAEGNAINWQLRMRRLQGIVDAAFQLGLPLQTQVDLDESEPFARLLQRLTRFSGLILHAETLPEAALLALHERGVPVVAINCYVQTGYCTRVQVNSRLGACSAVRHLLDLGHRRIALIVGDATRLSMRERLLGYRDALTAHDVPYDESLVVVEPRGWPQDAAKAVRRLLARRERRPTAIFTASDYRALGVLDALKTAGVAVPDEMSVVGFDDICEAESASPPLTTVANPLYESGRLAAHLLHEQLESGRVDASLRVLECTLRVRASSAAPISVQ
jgi:LacI family transcriptional regulator